MILSQYCKIFLKLLTILYTMKDLTTMLLTAEGFEKLRTLGLYGQRLYFASSISDYKENMHTTKSPIIPTETEFEGTVNDPNKYFATLFRNVRLKARINDIDHHMEYEAYHTLTYDMIQDSETLKILWPQNYGNFISLSMAREQGFEESKNIGAVIIMCNKETNKPFLTNMFIQLPHHLSRDENSKPEKLSEYLEKFLNTFGLRNYFPKDIKNK